ncbi:hypothetical protein VTK73DRAFT_9631 [Phialemonium thermophilum]|uniref:MARVEL domain-containing protein n=1 Tax=Phialemonium thermophilum TaxID=223376 RepID=A0ABR3XKK7_9PEZI
MAFSIVSIIHIVAFVFAFIELGLTAYLVSVFDGPWTSSPSEVNFMLFNSIWSLLVLLYIGITPLYYTHLFHRLASLALEAVTTIFWFAGSIALAADFGGPYHCGSSTPCGCTTAAITFGFFLWALFTVLTVLDTIESLRSRRHTTAQPKPYVGA